MAVARSDNITYNAGVEMTPFKVILIVFGTILLYPVLLSRVTRRLHHSPAPPFIGRFLDSRARRWVQSPDKLIARSDIKPDMKVLDLGCGSGAFTTFLARAVGKQGKVYAVDIQPKMLRQLERKLAKAGNQDINNIELKQASAYDLPFEDGALDAVIMVTVLPEIPDRARALREISRVLKPGGTLAVSELLPDPDYPLRSTTIRICQQEGFVLDADYGNLWNYTVRFRKPS